MNSSFSGGLHARIVIDAGQWTILRSNCGGTHLRRLVLTDAIGARRALNCLTMTKWDERFTELPKPLKRLRRKLRERCGVGLAEANVVSEIGSLNLRRDDRVTLAGSHFQSDANPLTLVPLLLPKLSRG